MSLLFEILARLRVDNGFLHLMSEDQLVYDIGNTSSTCEYYDIDEHNQYFDRKKLKNSFNVIALNVQSCNQNFVNFTTLLDQLTISYDAIILTETFLTPETNYTYEIDG